MFKPLCLSVVIVVCVPFSFLLLSAQEETSDGKGLPEQSKELDKNKDGNLSQKELSEVLGKALAQAAIKALDKNGDGMLSPAECRGYGGTFKGTVVDPSDGEVEDANQGNLFKVTVLPYTPPAGYAIEERSYSAKTYTTQQSSPSSIGSTPISTPAGGNLFGNIPASAYGNTLAEVSAAQNYLYVFGHVVIRDMKGESTTFDGWVEIACYVHKADIP